MLLLRHAGSFFKDKHWCHSVVNEVNVNVNIKISRHYFWLCSPQLFTFIYVREVMPLVTLVVLQWQSLVAVTLRYVYEICSDLSQLWGDEWLGDQSHPARETNLLHHYSIALLSKAFPGETFLSWDKFMMICAAHHSLTSPLMHFF